MKSMLVGRYGMLKPFIKAFQATKNSSYKTKLLMIIATYAAYINMRHAGMLPKKSLRGQHAFVTGAGNGIGRLVSIKLASQGVKVTVSDIDISAAEETVALITENGDEAIAIQCDITKAEDIQHAAVEARRAFGPVEILINNAGIVSGKKILDANERDIRLTYDVNTISHALTVREFLPNMIAANKGHIVTVASLGGTIGIPGLADYCGSKFAAFGFDESIRLELNKMNSKVKTTCVCPFFINTGMFEGVSTPFPLLPLLDQDWVSERIITAMRQEEQVLIMPWFGSMAFAARGILPTWAFDKLMNYVGATSSMEDFVGKGKKAKL